MPTPANATAQSWLEGTLLPRTTPPETVPMPQFSSVGSVAATLTIASALSVGTNMVDVRNGAMTKSQAVVNGVVKGTVATVILNATTRGTALQVVMAAGVLAGAGFMIDSVMKKDRKELCLVPEK